MPVCINPNVEKAFQKAFYESALSSLVEAGTPALYTDRYNTYKFDNAWNEVVSEATISFSNLVIPKKENLMYVYDVVVVSKKSDEIAFNSYILARSKDAAKLLALAQIMRDVKPTDEQVDDYHFAISQVGDGYTK